MEAFPTAKAILPLRGTICDYAYQARRGAESEILIFSWPLDVIHKKQF
jgi:hypothetical protein